MKNFEQIRSVIKSDYKITAREPYMVCIELSLEVFLSRPSSLSNHPIVCPP